MLWSVVSNESLGHFVPRAFHPTMTEVRQFDGVALPREDGIENGLATGSGDVAEHMVELQVHLAERLLHVQNVLGGHLQQAATVPPQGTNSTDRLGWPKACPQQSYRVQILDPLAVGYVALASRHTLQIVGVDQIDLEPSLLQDLKQRDPVHPCRLHRHALNPAPTEPISQGMQIAGEAAEPARRLLIPIGWYRDVNLLRANIDARRIRLQHHRSALSLLSSLCHGLLLVAGERGPRRESLQSPDRDRCTAPQTSSLTYPQPQTHAWGRAYQAPMPVSGRSLPRSPAHLSSLSSSSFRSYLNEVQSVASRRSTWFRIRGILGRGSLRSP